MAGRSLEERLAIVEAELARLKAQVTGNTSSAVPWWERIAGSFANDPIYAEAMRLGRKYRESLRPGAAKQRKQRHGNS